MSLILSIVVGGMLGSAINSSYNGRVSTFITGPESKAIQMYNPASLTSSGWYGEHAGKWLRVAAEAYGRTGDETMLKRAESVADYLISFQEPSGYIGCYKPEKRFYMQDKEKFNVTWDLWNTCYIMKGLVSLYKVSGEQKYLDADIKLAELMYDTFIVKGISIANTSEHSGLAGLGSLDAICDLYAVSPSEHLKTLIYRAVEELDTTPGLGLLKKSSMGLDVEYIGNGKIYEMLRCFTGLAKAYELFHEKYWLDALEGAWTNIHDYHLTPLGGPWGGVGLIKELFNRENCFSPYQVTETCSVMQWMELNEELLNITKDGRYADELEKSSYNALLAAMGTDGVRWVYYVRTNGDYSTGNEWSCCWSSGMTALEDITQCMYTTSGKTVYANILSPSDYTATIGGKNVSISETENYAETGKVCFKVSSNGKFALAVHNPDWAEGAACKVNGKDIQVTEKNGYLTVSRNWKDGDTFEIAFGNADKLRVTEMTRDYQDKFGWPSIFMGEITHHACFSVGPLIYASEFDDNYWNENNGKITRSGEQLVVTPSEIAAIKLDGESFMLGGNLFKPICMMPPYESSAKRSVWVKVKADEPQSAHQFRYMHNNDGTDLLGNRWCGCRPITVADLDRNVDIVLDSPVTTYVMCTGSDTYYYKSKYGRLMGDDLGGQIPVGKDTAQFNACHQYYINYMRLKAEGADFLGHIFQRVKSKGKETFISYRMNDLHTSSIEDACPLARPDVMTKHPEWLLNDGNAQGWHSSGSLNFALDAVRDMKIGIITEQLELYGSMIDGYEMDFLRFPVYFQPNQGPSHTACMTDMMKKVRAKVDSVSTAVGHKILLTVRIPASLHNNFNLGIDIKEWLRLGLVDFITVGAYWRGDPQLPIQEFKKELGSDLNVPLYATVDDGGYDKRVPWTQGHFRGMCSNILGQGADGICLFNFYFGDWYNDLNAGKQMTAAGGQVMRYMNPELMNELGTLKTLEGRNKIYLLNDGKKEYVLDPYTPLPITLTKGKKGNADLFVGDSLKDKLPKEVILFVRADGDIQTEINGNVLSVENDTYPALYDELRNMEKNAKVHAYIVNPSQIKHGFNQISFSSASGAKVRRVELALKYGDVETCGYF